LVPSTVKLHNREKKRKNNWGSKKRCLYTLCHIVKMLFNGTGNKDRTCGAAQQEAQVYIIIIRKVCRGPVDQTAAKQRIHALAGVAEGTHQTAAAEGCSPEGGAGCLSTC